MGGNDYLYVLGIVVFCLGVGWGVGHVIDRLAQRYCDRYRRF